MTFIFGVRVLFKALPIKDVMRFGKKRKNSPRIIRPFKVLNKFKDVAYIGSILNPLVYLIF